MSFFESEFVAEMIQTHFGQLKKLEDEEIKNLQATYKRIRQDLRDRLEVVQGDTFTAQQLRIVLVQIETALDAMKSGMLSDMGIQSLRKENAKYRTSAKERDDRLSALEEMQAKRDKALKAALGMEDEDDDVPVEQRLEAATQVQNQLAFQNEVLQLALENGITGDQNEYFQFLVSKAVSELGDDGEFTDEDLAEIVAKVKGVSGSAGSGSTSVGTSGEGQTPPPASSGSDTITAEDFAKMSFSEKGQLFGKNEALYKKLNAEATAKNLI
jgi:hypothetical protein